MPPVILGIEIGGTKLQLALGYGDGQILAVHSLRVKPDAGADGILEQIARNAPPLLAEAPGPLQAVGVGFGGPVDSAGMILTSHHVTGWGGFPLGDWLREKLSCPCVAIGNDSDLAALAEARFGAGVGCSPVLYVNSGSGIGGGLIVDGQIYRGAGRGAIEIGHLRIDDPYQTASESLPVILEAVASGWGIQAKARDALAAQDSESQSISPLQRRHNVRAGAGLTTQDIAAAAMEGDELALRILKRAAIAMGAALAHAATLLGPSRIILGGGVSLMPASLWIEPIRATVATRVFPPFRDHFDIVTAALGEAVVIHGALALARDALSDRP